MRSRWCRDKERTYSFPAASRADPVFCDMKDGIEGSAFLEKDREDHTDSDDICDIWHEEDGLEQFLQRFDVIEQDCDEKSNDDRDRNGDNCDQQCIR